MADQLSPTAPLSPPSEFLAACPKFRILVLGNPESTKQELFTKIFGVDLEKKVVDDSFSPAHDIGEELDLQGQNSRLAIHASLNFGTDDEAAYRRACKFLRGRSAPSTKLEDRIHSIWYCVASEEDRSVAELEKRFFSDSLGSAAPNVPIILIFTKYEEFVSQVKIDWSRDAEERGLSKVAVSHILRDLSSKKFEKHIGQKWTSMLGGTIPRVCVSSGDSEDDAMSFEALTGTTLASLRNRNVKFAFAAAQRNSASICTRFCASTAADYFEVGTGHARKLHGVDMRDILPNFLAKSVQLFNLHDSSSLLDDSAALLPRILDATFESSQQKPILTEALRRSGTEPGTIMSSLSPHERAVLLTQALTAVVHFLHRLAADTQWPLGQHGEEMYMHTLTARAVSRVLEEIRSSEGERKKMVGAVEASPLFTTCTLKKAIADLIERAAGEGRVSGGEFGGGGGSVASHRIVVEDDSELQEISMSYVNDKGPNDVTLPCGLTILPLT